MGNQTKSGLATAGLVLGIIGIIFSFFPIINNLAFVMGILSLVFGIICLIKKASKGTAIASLILGILTMAITLQVQSSTGKALEEVSKDIETSFNTASGGNTEEVLNNYFEVKLGSFEVNTDEYGLTDTKLIVTVKNKTNEKQSGNIEIEAVDSEGKRLNSDTVYINELNAGQTQDFETFNLISSDKVEQLKKAEFKILSASAY